MSFEGKVVLITGGSRGIGAACAEYFAKEGALLSLVGRNQEKFAQVIEKLREIGVESEPLVILADVNTDAERIMNETIEKYGRLDILINNAGFSILGDIEKSSMDDFDAMMGTNVRAVFELTKFAVPHLCEAKGNIVNVSSIAALRAFPYCIVYCMTKAALDQFTKCLAVGLAGKGVRVNSVNPGVVDTDFYQCFGIEKGTDEYDALMEDYRKNYPIGRIGSIEDCVHAISTLVNDKSSFLTGVILPVDGGITVKS